MSKGSRQRTLNSEQFNDSYDRIFGAKNDNDKRVPQNKEEEYSGEQRPKTGKEEIV